MSQTQGQVDGRPAALHLDDINFSWSETQHGEADKEWSQIPIENIIAIAPSSSGESNESSILFTTDNYSADGDAKETPLVFKSINVTGAPESLVKRFKLDEHFPWQRHNRNGTTPQINVIVSTGSGTGLAPSVWEQLVQPLLEHVGFTQTDYVVNSTTSESSVSELVQSTILPQANQGIAQSILLLSGDGGIVDIVNTLLSGEHTEKYRKPTLALLPLGTGNAMANSAVITPDKTMGLRTMLSRSLKEVPIFRATFSPGTRLLVNEGKEAQHLQGIANGMPAAYGAVVCSWGLHATLVADSDTAEYRQFGAERFKMAGKEALFPSDGSLPHAYKGRVSVLRPGKADWEAIPRHDHGYILATLVQQLEAGFTVSPSSQPLDGQLRLVHFGHMSGQDAMDIMGKAYQGGKHVEDERIGYEEIVGLRINFDEEDGRWRRVCIDGKIFRVEEGGWVEVSSDLKGVVDLISKDY